ncbi:MAG: transglycosylase SLT domain-containing protein [Bacteroidota bacterium]
MTILTIWGVSFTYAYGVNDTLEIPEAKPLPMLDTLPPVLENYIPKLHQELIKDRLACMQGSIKMTYHKDVMKWIEFYTVRDRAYTQRILERSEFFFPIFEEALRRHNMPDELKYLSIVESALIPKAQSWAAAVGLWQFIPSTGKAYGLEQDWFIDERMDIYKSTDAACRYLKFLYKYHGDWQLALAAYNCGPGRVNWAVKRAGGKKASFWTIYNYLPRETRSYVPAFIGACYSMTYSEEHFIFAKNPLTYIPSDTILVNQFLNIQEFAKQMDIPQEQIEQLNPHLKKNAIPAYKKNYPLRFPAEKKAYLEANRTAILRACAYASKREVGYTAGKRLNDSSTKDKFQKFHKVRAGESLAFIAQKYKVSVNSIRVWNRMRSNLIYPNQKLSIWVPGLPPTVSLPQKEEPRKFVPIDYIKVIRELKLDIDISSLSQKN